MKRSRLHKRTAWCFVIFQATLAACAAPDAVMAPALSAEGIAAPAMTLSSMSRDGTQMTIVDQNDGLSYTYDALASEIRVSTGDTLVLDAGQASEAGAAFLRTIEGDRMVPDLENLPRGSCAPDDPMCVDPYRFPEGDGSESSEIIIEIPAIEQFGSPPLRLPALNGRGRTGQRPVRRPTAAGVELMFDDPCTDIANAALRATDDFRVKRTSWIKDTFIAAIGEAANALKRYPLVRGGIAMGVFVNSTANQANASVQLSVMSFMWNREGCGYRTVTAGPIWLSNGGGSGDGGGGSGGSGGGGGGGFWCAMQWVEISFNGYDGPWHRVYVEVCTYTA